MRLRLAAAIPVLAALAACTAAGLEPVAFRDLPGWRDDRVLEGMAAIAKTCPRLVVRDPAWAPFCGDVGRIRSEEEARALLRRHLRAVRVPGEGLFTGYFEPELAGALEPSARFRVPLYGKPGDLVEIRLGDFRSDLEGRVLHGRVAGNRILPYHDRAAIDAGALAGRGLEIAWVEDAVEAFFLHIQGSGRVRLPDGRRIRVGYAGKNGQPYRAIGADLIASGALSREEVSMQTITAWLRANPEEGRELMARNRSFVFFRPLEGDGPIGTAGVALTPGRSLAVDRSHVPLGVPLWLDTERPDGVPIARLVVAQDTGGAIRGPVRGDLFWGAGEEAARFAGAMKSRGRYYRLEPRTPRNEEATR